MTMLTEQEQREIEEELGHYPDPRAACIEALKILQRHRGWISDETLGALGRFLKMTPDELEAVASFYNLIFRKPVGRHVIFVCNSVSCWMRKADELRDVLLDRLGIPLGGTTADGRFTVLPIVCLGACHRAPALLVDEDTHGNVTAAELPALLQRYE